jgi:hypothetical protein
VSFVDEVMKHLYAVVALCAVSSVANAEKKPYSLADLKSLVAQKSYKEAVAHLSDVAPAERKDEWLTIAADAASGYIASLSNDDAIVKIIEIERVDGEFPALLKSPKYTKARTDVGPPAFARCFANGWYEECRDHAWKFVSADPTNGDLGFAMGKVVRRGTSSYWVTLRFFKPAFTAKPAKARCTDDDVQMSVLAGFGVSADNDALPIAKDIASACWDHVRKPLVEAFDADAPDGRVRANACGLLKAKKALNAAQLKTCK